MKQKNIVILGGGESGVGAARLAAEKGYNVLLSEKNKLSDENRYELEHHKIFYEEGKHTESIILGADLIIKSPGIPETAPIMEAIRLEHIEVVSEIEFASRFISGQIIAITGTNGKTTTTLLTHHLLKSAGLNVCIAGNIGKSLAREAIEDNYDYYVVEVSSFQLDDIDEFRPHVAILLNITPDHLDRYNYQIENYVQSKFKINENQSNKDFFIYNEEDIETLKYLRFHRLAGRMLPINISKQSEYLSLQNKIRISATPAQMLDIPIADLPLKGKHNFLNIVAAGMAAQIVGLSDEQIVKGLKSFVNAPHRLEKIKTIKGVTFINDSKATNVDAVSYALASFDKPLIWIAGGVDKGNEYELIEETVKKNVRAIVCLGKDNEKLITFFKGKVSEIRETDSIKKAIEIAFSLAESEDIVLLSPACASFDLFKNYEDRGDQFRRYVQELALNIKDKKETESV
ncbi:UDP-N-acetylmuramoyl-L-alanine--D-glutamate ligase [Bernardetia sp.]|uniref:UDP-N-acetylmuramoyl-L-alanine--D-glutamate ligase n=1 Tax=Bernardetia sp. TaxID=1937974 RepID=UPI0025C46345|nr:UDP-N-acetylmuramoyl-L-alanine--D-glutamate ligase [Bernardetia sp.]